MGRQVPAGVVGVDKGAIDNGHTLEDVAEGLAEVVAVLERGGVVQYNIDLDV